MSWGSILQDTSVYHMVPSAERTIETQGGFQYTILITISAVRLDINMFHQSLPLAAV